jgi:hypothetical protein
MYKYDGKVGFLSSVLNSLFSVMLETLVMQFFSLRMTAVSDIVHHLELIQHSVPTFSFQNMSELSEGNEHFPK